MAQQSRKVTGTVLDYAKEPIIGANVILKGTSRGVITDVKGEFTLDNVTTASIIQNLWKRLIKRSKSLRNVCL